MKNFDLAETIGIVSGIIVGLVVIVMPMVTNAFALRHRSINGRCALSVIFTLGGTLVGGVAAKLTLMTTSNHYMLAIPAAFAMVCYAIGTILAIIGLREIRRRRGRYRGGKRRAISMLVLNGIHAAVFAGAVYVGVAGLPSLTRPGAEGKEVRSEEWNFRLAPPADWVTLAGAKGDPTVRAMFVRKKPEMHLSVLAEKPEGAKPAALAASVDLVKAQIQGGGGNLILDEPLAVNGCAGHRIESEGLSGAVRFFFVHWIFAHNGTLYQVVASGAPEEHDFIRAESVKVLTGFHLLDPKRTAQPAVTRDDTQFHSEHYGYTVNLRGTPWTRRWETLAKDNPFAEFGVQNAAGNAAFVVIPVAIGEAELENNMLAHALAVRVGVPFPSAGVTGLKDWTQGPMEGQAFSFERKTKDAAFVFRLRALSGRGCAYLLAAWADKRALASGDFLEQALDRVSFSAKAPVLPRDLEPRTDRDRVVQSLVCNDIGLALDGAGHSDQALAWFLRAVKFSPREAPFLTNAVEMCLKFGRPADALTLLDRALPNFPDDQKLAATRARVLVLTGDTAGAEKILATLLAAGWRDDAQLGEYTRTLCQRGLTSGALATLDRYGRGADTPALQRMRALVFQARKEFDKAIVTLLEARKAAPADTETTLSLAEAYAAALRPSDAIAEYARLLATHPDSAPLLQRKGAAEFALKRYRDAKATFETALQKDPASAEIKRILDHVTGLLAAGDSASVRKPIEPVAIPASLLAETPQADPADSGASYRRVVRAIEFVKGGEFKSTEHAVIAVRDELGVGKFSTIDFRFDAPAEEIFVNSLVVKNAKGEPAGTLRIEDAYLVGDGTGDFAAQPKLLQVPVPGLQPGCTIEYTVTRRESAAPAEFPFRSHAFFRAVPVARSVLFVKAPADSVKWEASPGVPEPKRAEGGLVWTVDAPPVPRTEPFPAQPDTFLPTLALGSPAATWPGVVKEYLAEIKERLPIDPAVRASAAATTAGLAGDSEKIAALARFVQKEIAYKPAEITRRARIPNPAPQILRDKSGDSKDHALLLMQLLESVGIPARFALVNPTATVRPGLPSPDQFNHAIVFVPAGESGAFIDSTGKTTDLRKSPPPGLAGGRALILDPERPRLAAIPEHPATGASGIRVKRDITFPNESDADIRETAVIEGAGAQSLRGSLLTVEAAQRNATVQQALVREVPGAVLISVRIDALDDPQSPLKIETRYLLRGRFSPAGGQMSGRLPCFWEGLFLRAEPVEKRATPFRIPVPTQIESTATLTPPVGHLCTAPAQRPLENAFDRGTATARIDANKLVIEVRIARRGGQFPAAQYRAFTDAASAAAGLIEQNVVLQKPGAR